MPSILAMVVTGSHKWSSWPGLLVNVLMFRIDALNLILEQALGDAVGVARGCFAQVCPQTQSQAINHRTHVITSTHWPSWSSIMKLHKYIKSE